MYVINEGICYLFWIMKCFTSTSRFICFILMIMFEVGMYTQVLVYSITHSLSAQKQYKHKGKPGFIFQLNLFNRIFWMLGDVKITNVFFVHLIKSSCYTTNSVYAICPVYISGKCYCKELYENLQKMFNQVQFGWVVKKYEMR